MAQDIYLRIGGSPSTYQPPTDDQLMGLYRSRPDLLTDDELARVRAMLDAPDAPQAPATGSLGGAIQLNPNALGAVPLSATTRTDSELRPNPNAPPLQAPGMAELLAPVARGASALVEALDRPPVPGMAEGTYTTPMRMMGTVGALIPEAVGTVMDMAQGRERSRTTASPLARLEDQTTWASELGHQGVDPRVAMGVGTLLDLVADPIDLATGGATALATLPLGVSRSIRAVSRAGGFYSRLERAAATLPAKGMKAESVLNALKRAPEGLSAEELAWRRVPEFLESRKGQVVTPADLQAHLEANALPVDVITRAQDLSWNRQSRYALPEVVRAIESANGTPSDIALTLANDGDAYRALTARFPELREADNWDDIVLKELSPVGGDTRYNQKKLVVPGGERYQETLFTLPDRPANSYDDVVSRLSAKYGQGFDRDVLTDGERALLSAAWDRINRAASGYSEDVFRQSHFNTPNVLMHTRANERTLTTGERGRFIEEVQSDWHQQGKDRGYRLPPLTDSDIETRFVSPVESGTVPAGHDPSLYPGYWEAYDKRTGALIISGGGNDEAGIRREALFVGPREYGAVPNAPFRDAWPELGLKQQLLEAARDPETQWLGFTTGETQAKRYDLSKQISEVHLSGSNFKAYDKNGRTVMEQTGVTRDMLPGMIGKELSEKLLAQEPRGTLRSLYGEDIRVGGEGMLEFYDKLLRKRLERLVKPFGGRVELLRVAAGKGRTAPAWVVRLTPEMKRAILTSGLPLLSLGGIMATGAGQREAE